MAPQAADREEGIRRATQGAAAMNSGAISQARTEYNEALAVFEALAKSDPTSAMAQADLSISYNKLGDIAVAMGELAEAKHWYDRAWMAA